MVATIKEKIAALQEAVRDIEDLFIGMDKHSVFKESVFYLDSMRRIEILNEMIKELESTIGG